MSIDHLSPTSRAARASTSIGRSVTPGTLGQVGTLACKSQVRSQVVTVIEEIAERVGPAVVGLRTAARGGSGVVVAPGVVATLSRNVRGNTVSVVTADGSVHE